MEYETFKHDIVDIRVEEDNIYIIFALSRRIDDNNFSYIGSKRLNIIVKENKYIIKNIQTYIN